MQVILDGLGSPEAELSILITDDEDIAKLNEKYLQREGPTNVIAFPMYDNEISPANEILKHQIGDVVISVDTTKKESETLEIDFQTRFFQLLIHGTLHLFGYDHETNEADAIIMEEKSEELLKLIMP